MIIGFEPAARAWADWPGPGVVELPPLRGELSVGEAELDAAARDFGNRVHRRPLAVLRPGGATDVAAMVRFGRRCGIPVVPRGAGHAVDGQAQTDGIVIDLTALRAVHRIGADRIEVDAGARWSTVVDAALLVGLVPPVLPDYLELTVGGILSAGGFGGASHRHGAIADRVLELEVVTPDGELTSCSAEHNDKLFDAVRGTQGEHGIITRATVALAPARVLARRYVLTYRELGPFLADQLRVMADRRFDQTIGQARHTEADGWSYTLEALAAYDPPDEPDDATLLDGLAHQALERQDMTLRQFLYRLVPFEAQLRELGSWQDHPHPRCNVLLPGRHAEAVIADSLAGLRERDLGLGGNVLLYPVPTGLLGAPGMPKAADPVTWLFGLQRTAPPGDAELIERMRLGNEELRATVRRLGGVDYTYPTAYHRTLHGS
ncbi:FAD-binding protein [Kitasatospora sp. NPDC049285]|uniref:FAD-binding protein n=1 Tax=Kitasatospora sp. NPDC049285 TaxID=3157096 RepID=UPI00341D06E1